MREISIAKSVEIVHKLKLHFICDILIRYVSAEFILKKLFWILARIITNTKEKA